RARTAGILPSHSPSSGRHGAWASPAPNDRPRPDHPARGTRCTPRTAYGSPSALVWPAPRPKGTAMLAADFALGEALWTVFVIFLWITWLWLLFAIFGDLFSDPDTSGGAKAGWTILVLILPYLGIFIYLIARGGGMAERSMNRQRQAKAE